MTTRTKLLASVGALVGTLTLLTVAGQVPGFADKVKPPKAAIDQIRKMHDHPAADPDDISGPVDPSKMALALILRDPQTGDVLRDQDGLPRVLTNPDGSTANVRPDQVPADQQQAQAKHLEKLQRAANGDPQAKKDLDDEATKTADAVNKKLHK